MTDTAPAERVWTTASGPSDAPPIILVHGTLDRSAGLVKLARRLSDRFRVIRFDRRGYGRSRGLSGSRSVSANVDDLVAIIDEFTGTHKCAQRVGLFGHSFGGNVCLAASAARRDLVGAVAVYESPLSWRPEWFASSGYAEPNDWSGDPAGAAESFMRRLVGDAIWERLPAATRQDRRSEGITMVEELIDLRSRAPWSAELVDVPVLAMYGENGLAHHRRAMEIVASELQGEIVEVIAANHFGPNTQPQKVADRVGGFFGRYLSPSGPNGSEL